MKPIAGCSNCGTVFTLPIGPDVTLKDCASNCPNCGKIVAIPDMKTSSDSDPDMIFDSDSPGGVALLHGLRQLSPQSMALVRDSLLRAQSGQASQEETIAEIETLAPSLSRLLHGINNWSGLLTVALAMLALLLNMRQPSPVDEDRLDQYVEILVELAEGRSNRDQVPPPLEDLFSERKQGRNEPCACGSGSKHKYCCGSVVGEDSP